MNEIEIVKKLLEIKKMSYAILADNMGHPTHSAVSNRMYGRSITVEVLLDMLKGMDCELIIRNKVGDKEVFVVDNENRRETKRSQKKEGNK